MKVCGIQAQSKSKTKLSIKVIKEKRQVSVFLCFSFKETILYLPTETKTIRRFCWKYAKGYFTHLLLNDLGTGSVAIWDRKQPKLEGYRLQMTVVNIDTSIYKYIKERQLKNMHYAYFIS